MNKVAEIITKLLAGGVLKDVTGLLDEVITTKEERQTLLNELKKHEFQHEETIEAIKARIYEKELEFMQTELNSEVELRKQAVRLQEANNSEHSTLLNKAIAPILALSATACAILVYVLVLTAHLKATEPTVLLVISNVTNVVLVVFGFYFGSSVGSKIKDSQLEKFNKK
jgi:hypothetical protein